jgi:hypothetical protein
MLDQKIFIRNCEGNYMGGNKGKEEPILLVSHAREFEIIIISELPNR